jgi:V8-like Glu-specific endopeptidase
MRTLTTAILLSATVWAVPALAQQAGGANEGDGAASRAAPMDGDYTFGRAKPIAPPKIEADEASRAAPADETKAVDSLTVLTRTRDGKETRTAPSDELKSKVLEILNGPADAGKTSAGDKAQMAPDPALGEDTRQVFGTDDRVQITATKTYPFSAIGYIEAKSKQGYGSCTGTLIGPRTVLTAAHCLYSNDDKAWLDEVIFIPGLNGPEDVPFGAYQNESVSILEGFVTNYQGYYGSVVPWDLGIITLAQPIGDNLGWLGYANYDNLGDFDANIVGYPGDKPSGTMWRATCGVVSENIGDVWFQYDCDTYPGSSGSAVYAYDNGSKQRIVVGVNVAESPDANTAVRLNAAYIEWINGLWK